MPYGKEAAMNEPDEVLYERYRLCGDENAFRLLLERYRERLTLFLDSYVHNLSDAEDLMIDAFAVAASGTAKFRGKSSFRTWLYGIGRNLAKNHLRKHRVRPDALSESAAAVPADYDVLREERYAQLYTALANISGDYRQVLYLLYFEELSESEAAAVTGKSKKQIYNLVSRGKNALRAELEKMGFDYA